MGPRTAEAVVAYIDDARRFAHNKYEGSYFGLVPSQYQSSDRNRLGHITREDPSTMHRLVTFRIGDTAEFCNKVQKNSAKSVKNAEF